ncbi:MAG: hypothetical protein WC788_00200 [Candidatus Paceibacterota bacterium]|jgi:hypothetical protein
MFLTDIFMKMVIFFGCKTGLYHLRAKWTKEGLVCEDCGYFEDKAAYQASLHSGAG